MGLGYVGAQAARAAGAGAGAASGGGGSAPRPLGPAVVSRVSSATTLPGTTTPHTGQNSQLEYSAVGFQSQEVLGVDSLDSILISVLRLMKCRRLLESVLRFCFLYAEL